MVAKKYFISIGIIICTPLGFSANINTTSSIIMLSYTIVYRYSILLAIVV